MVVCGSERTGLGAVSVAIGIGDCWDIGRSRRCLLSHTSHGKLGAFSRANGEIGVSYPSLLPHATRVAARGMKHKEDHMSHMKDNDRKRIDLIKQV